MGDREKVMFFHKGLNFVCLHVWEVYEYIRVTSWLFYHLLYAFFHEYVVRFYFYFIMSNFCLHKSFKLDYEKNRRDTLQSFIGSIFNIDLNEKYCVYVRICYDKVVLYHL